MRAWAFGSGILILGVAIAATQGSRPATVNLAKEFLGSLSPNLRAKAAKSFSDDYRTNWQFVPIARQGVNLGEMTTEQTRKGIALLENCLSEAGIKRTSIIKSLEDVLFEMENKNPGRDKRLYTFTFFGDPSTKGDWAWRYEGHHVSLNFTFKDGALISSSPQFFGANPAEVRTGPNKGLRALPKEQDLAFALLDTLTDDQKSKAVIGTSAPNDIVTGNSRKAAIQKDTGLKYSDMNEKQKEALMALIKVYVESQSTQEQKRRMGRVDKDSLVFAWMGAAKPGAGHYYRVQGSKFLIEYDNTQNNANHIHSVWRDFDGDFGQDVLAEHYHSAHQAGH